MKTAAPRLYGITDNLLMPGQVLFDKAEAALAGGCHWLQYRDKTTDSIRREREARQLLDLCNTYGAKLIINDDVALAGAIGAHGVHVGQDDVDAATARAQLGDDAIVGVTCHARLNLALDAQRAGASYVAFGRFFTSNTKPGAQAATLDVLTQAKHALTVPIVAIGGITLHNAAQVIAAGADTLAVCGSLFDCPTPAVRARAFCEL
jgi:thiamine-phosphate pyrophosphorylase